MSHRERLIRFYTKYAPDKLGNVDAALRSFAGREDYMFQTLVKKYGPEPPADDGPASVSSGSNAFRERMVRFLQHYEPSKVAQVDKLIASGKGNEEMLMKKLVERFGPEPPAPAPAATKPVVPPLSVGNISQQPTAEHRERLVRFYTKYAPDKLGNVDAALRSFAGREDYMFQTLVKKYGPEPPADDGAQPEHASSGGANPTTPRGGSTAPPHTDPTTSGDNTALKARVVRFLQHYDPAKLDQVDKLIATTQGNEKRLMQRLVSRYGPEPGDGAAQPPAALAAEGRAKSTPRAGGAGASPRTPAGEIDWKARVTQYLQARAPDKIGNVDQLLAKYQGREKEMMAALINRYGAETAPKTPTASSNSDPAAAATAPPDDSSKHRERLIRFYQRYAPEKIEGCDVALQTFAGREEVMFTALVKKYGPEPPAQDEYRHRVKNLLEVRAPDRLSSLDTMLERYQGKEEEMLKTLVKKLGPEPTQEEVEAAQAQRSRGGTPRTPRAGGQSAPLTWKERLTAYFTARAPEKLPQVDLLLQKYQGKEEEMMKALVSRFGPEPSSAQGEAAGVATETNANQASEPAGEEAAPRQVVEETSFSAKLHVLSRIGSTAAQRLRTSYAPLFPPSDSSDYATAEEFFYTMGLVVEYCDFTTAPATQDEATVFSDYPTEVTDMDRDALVFIRSIWALQTEQAELEALLCMEEEQAFQQLAQRRNNDRDRIQQLLTDRRRHHRQVLSKAMDLIGTVELRLRHDIEEKYRLEWLGQVKWFKEQRDRILLCSAPPQLKILEQKMENWKRMVRENEEDIREYASARRQEKLESQRCEQLEYEYHYNLPTWADSFDMDGGADQGGGSPQPVGVYSTKATPRKSSIPRPATRRNVEDDVSRRIREFGTPSSPYYPRNSAATTTPRRGTTNSTSVGGKTPKTMTPRSGGRETVVTDSGRFVVPSSVKSPRVSHAEDGAIMHDRLWNQHKAPNTPASKAISQTQRGQVVDHGSVRLPPKLNIPNTVPVPFGVGTPGRSSRRPLNQL